MQADSFFGFTPSHPRSAALRRPLFRALRPSSGQVSPAVPGSRLLYEVAVRAPAGIRVRLFQQGRSVSRENLHRFAPRPAAARSHHSFLHPARHRSSSRAKSERAVAFRLRSAMCVSHCLPTSQKSGREMRKFRLSPSKRSPPPRTGAAGFSYPRATALSVISQETASTPAG